MTKITIEDDTHTVELNFVPLKDPDTKEETGKYAMSVDFNPPREQIKKASPMFKSVFMSVMQTFGYGREEK